MRIALVGAGAMGTIIGALIARGGEDIVLVDVNEPHVKALSEKVAKITGHMDITVPVKAITPAEMEGLYDLVIYLVKTVYDDTALPELLPFIQVHIFVTGSYIQRSSLPEPPNNHSRPFGSVHETESQRAPGVLAASAIPCVP